MSYWQALDKAAQTAQPEAYATGSAVGIVISVVFAIFCFWCVITDATRKAAEADATRNSSPPAPPPSVP